MTVHFKLDTTAVNQWLDLLGDQLEASLRPIAQSGAQVYYDALLSEYDRIVKNKTFNLRNAIYQAYRDLDSTPDAKFYGVSWAGVSKKSNKASQHGHLIEFGHYQRYALAKNKRGEWVTAVRRGAKRPSPKDARHWTQEQRDAYFIPLKGGERWVAPRPFVRNTMNNQANRQRAYAAMFDSLSKRFGGAVI